MCGGPQEYITYEFVPASPAVSCVYGSSSLNSFRDRRQVAVQLVSCGVLPPGLVQDVDKTKSKSNGFILKVNVKRFGFNNLIIGLMVRMFANGSGDLGSIPSAHPRLRLLTLITYFKIMKNVV